MLTQASLRFVGGRPEVKFKFPIKGFRKVNPIVFTELYLAGTKMVVIAKKMRVSVQSLKAARKRLRLPVRPSYREPDGFVYGGRYGNHVQVRK